LKLGEFCAENGVEINTIGLNAARQAVLIAPHSAEALDMMGRLLFLSGDSSSGERFLQRALEQDPDFIPAHFHLGQLYLKEDCFQPSYEHLLIVSRSSEKIKEVSLAKRLLASYFPNR
jgi:tetratricopeptide (TPR) repeat protein